uniref:Uncharacterized protein n=1 Tax=Pseudomonas phage RVTF4 TaxID=3236931 RepID=A0AB39CCG4_9VIRU
MPLIKDQYVTLKQEIKVKALKGRSYYSLGTAGMKFKVVRPHETLAGYFYMNQLENTNAYPPQSVLHFTEVNI